MAIGKMRKVKCGMKGAEWCVECGMRKACNQGVLYCLLFAPAGSFNFLSNFSPTRRLVNIEVSSIADSLSPLLF